MSLIRCDRAGAVAHLTLARTGMQNALVPELLRPLKENLSRLAGDPECRCVVLRSAGEAAFSIGGDMRRFARVRDDDPLAYADELVGLLNDTLLAMIDLPQPVVVAVPGIVTGGSLGLVLAADIVLLAPQAAFKAHYVSAGFGPDGGWTALLPRLVGARRAAGALLLNRTLRAEEALDWGLANEIVPADELAARAGAIAQRLASTPTGTLRAAKRLLWRDRDAIAAALAAEHRHFLELIGGVEANAGIDRFLATFTDYPNSDE